MSFSGLCYPVQLMPTVIQDRALSRLERRGWVRPLAMQERRRPYAFTAAGEAVLAEQLTSMQRVVRTGQRRTATD